MVTSPAIVNPFPVRRCVSRFRFRIPIIPRMIVGMPEKILKQKLKIPRTNDHTAAVDVFVVGRGRDAGSRVDIALGIAEWIYFFPSTSFTCSRKLLVSFRITGKRKYRPIRFGITIAKIMASERFSTFVREAEEPTMMSKQKTTL